MAIKQKQKRARLKLTRMNDVKFNPDIFKRAFPENPPVSHTIQRNAPCQAEISHRCLLVNISANSQHDLFGHTLHGGCKVHFPHGDLGFRFPRRGAKKFFKAAARHGQSRAVIEIRLIESERSILFQIDDLQKHLDARWNWSAGHTRRRPAGRSCRPARGSRRRTGRPRNARRR